MIRWRWLPAFAGMTLLCTSVVAADETFAGLPRAQQPDAEHAAEVLRNPGFLVGYSEARKQPLWVAYLARSPRGHRLPPRPDHFEPDVRTRARVTSRDYSGSHYERGHLAPNYIIGKLYGARAQRATFLMSNVSPQAPRLNDLVWQRLEEAEADVVAPGAGELWVLAGPVFDAHPRTLRKSHIPIPEAFFRIWLERRDDGPHALAFIVPQDVCGAEPLSRYVVSVHEVEQRTGLDFFSALPDPQERALERPADTSGWQLDRYDRRMPRYADKFDSLQCEP